QCPSCGETLVYAHHAGFRRACRLKSLCRRCAASPSVIEKIIIEQEQRRAAKVEGRNPLAAFFQRIEAEISGSMPNEC
ncbi:MAG TPA: hypothetical protein PKM73_05000, partial [Verrucomicrobiota bacterium]|nr:hypothetical protein [Verrucomicrobiota bacterium]